MGDRRRPRRTRSGFATKAEALRAMRWIQMRNAGLSSRPVCPWPPTSKAGLQPLAHASVIRSARPDTGLIFIKKDGTPLDPDVVSQRFDRF